MAEPFTMPSPESFSAKRLPKRVILHWTGGVHRSSTHDREHYHGLVEFDPEDRSALVVRGVPIINNMQAASRAKIYREDPINGYGPHTRGFNSYSIAYSVCGMLGATSRADLGVHLITAEQIDALITLCADTARAFEMAPIADVSDKTFFTHYEAHTLHGVAQNPERDINARPHKWDITWIPNEQDLGPDDVGPWIRDRIRAELAG